MVWAFPTWQKTLRALVEDGHTLAGIYLFPEKLGKMKGWEATTWYGRVFGWWTFALLVCYALLKSIKRLGQPVRTWEQLAQQYGVPLLRGQSPNEATVVRWVKENEVDVVLIMVSHILKGDILHAPRLGIINKHAALLPSCRGVFPYFWAVLHGLPTGITFHSVDEGIDTGNILVQRAYTPRQGQIPSMLAFYHYVYDVCFAEMAIEAVRALRDGRTQPSLYEGEPSYFGFPTRANALAFYARGGRIARLHDLFTLFPQHKEN